MITDKLENLENYLKIFPQISDLIEYLKDKDLSQLQENETFKKTTLIPLVSKKNDNFDATLLEAHRSLMDVHITLKGTDIIAYQFLDDKVKVSKEYNEKDDYLLANGNEIISLDVPEGYFCIIPNHFAHMALYNVNSGIEKVVVKMSSN